MKNYLDFKLSGKKILPYYLVILISTIAYLFVSSEAQLNQSSDPAMSIWSLAASFVHLTVIILVYFFMIKLAINAISYKNENLQFNGNFGEYVKINIVGVLLSIITLGVYVSWYEKRLMDFFARNTSYKTVDFKFNGRAIILFAILSIAIVITSFTTIPFALGIKENPQSTEIYQLLLFTVLLIIITPVVYLVYRWSIDFTYENKTIKMTKGGYLNGSLFCIGQFVLIIITLGLYYPAAIIRIYRYFANHIEVINNEGTLHSKMGCETKMGEDYLFIFAQILLSSVTLGIYYPWALCAIGNRLISKTYFETTEQ